MLDRLDGDDQPIVRDPKAEITLPNLLTHTSGFVYEIWGADMAKYLEVTGLPSILTLEKASLTAPLMFNPGTKMGLRHRHRLGGPMVEQVKTWPP